MTFNLARLLYLLLPPACPLCAGTLPFPVQGPLCPTCMAGVLPLPPAHCPHCALPYVDSGATAAHLCSRCLLEPPVYRATYAAGLYQQQLRLAVQHFKFHQRPGLDRCLGTLLERALPKDLPSDLVIPVPLHPARLRQRTYNQALLLAREIGRRRRLEVADTLLIKACETVPQQELNARQRWHNLRDVFRLQQQVRGRHVLLVDDVMTTGATAASCSRVLLDGGAAEVRVAVVGRAPQ